MVAAILPRTQQHKDQAQHNYNCLLSIDKTINKDWIITISFYSALHYVTAHAVQNRVNLQPQPADRFSPHQKRIRYVRRNLRSKFNDFMRLYQESQNARYDPLYYSRFSGDIDLIINIAHDFKRVV